MCGILCIFRCLSAVANGETGHGGGALALRELAFRQSSSQRHRGPDYTGVLADDVAGFALVQERLSVIGVKTGNQPFTSTDGTVHLVANGEIYNFRRMAGMIGEAYEPRSDCDVLVAFYERYGPTDLLTTVRGMFAFVCYDQKTGHLLVARDPVGIIPLYSGRSEDGALWFASEMKCLVGRCRQVAVFPPGHAYYGPPEASFDPQPYFSPPWLTEIPTMAADLVELRNRLEAAVESHLQCDVPMGALLSGGLDSSLIAAIAVRCLRRRTGDRSVRLKTYSIGLPGAGPDLHYARLVSEHIGSDHTEIHFTLAEGLDYIRDAVYHSETYDVTTIRCIVPVMLLARYIRSEGLKMVLSGEGADELFGGYLYFHRAPDAPEFHRETVRRVRGLHLSDCLRANKGCAAWGLELRVPFLDTDFLQYVMSIRPEDRIPGGGRPEKYILRKAFADGDYLPAEVLWRQKEQFSDGVGYSWIDTVSEWAASRVSDRDFERAAERFPVATPKTKEAFYYRQLFEERFPGTAYAQTVQQWTPRTDWGCAEDPSGRKQDVHRGVTVGQADFSVK
ncbi:asparagine synthetase B [glutamine-hydrolyzing] [Anopheles bellator]|uniref:asparagine synthetase B [glutamine-hydrolyzing] n=1 Tax=Anopheles bellator TaxID=139047 RepID=UPI002649D5F8|nr:asparagine synthetase B [glutamine-hydrolyzing] [Anopheles bellator]